MVIVMEFKPQQLMENLIQTVNSQNGTNHIIGIDIDFLSMT